MKYFFLSVLIVGSWATAASGQNHTPGSPWVWFKSGLVHKPTIDDDVKTIALEPPVSHQFTRLTVEMDVKHGGWAPPPGNGKGPSGFHVIFWVTRGAWADNLFGYVSVRGPEKNELDQQTNVDFNGRQATQTATATLWLVPGETYHFKHVYDSKAGNVHTIVSHKGMVVAYAAQASTAVDPVQTPKSTIPGKPDQFQLWLAHAAASEGPEVPTYGWEYSNVLFKLENDPPDPVYFGRDKGSVKPRALAADAGPLRVHPVNPIYFADASGRAIYLGGHQMFLDLQDRVFDYNKTARHSTNGVLNWSWYADFLKSHNMNYVRNWTQLSTGAAVGGTGTTPMPFQRVAGSGNANDGGLKFDLRKFDQLFFDRMRSRIMDLKSKGAYVSIMLFDAYSFTSSDTWSGWRSNVFNGENNVNGVDTDPNKDGKGFEFFFAPPAQVQEIQRAYVAKIIDTVGDLENVMFEIANELGAKDWEYGMIDFIKGYQSSKAGRHLVFLSPGGRTVSGAWIDLPQIDIVNSSADVIAVNKNWTDYAVNPPSNDTGKPCILDMDHGWAGKDIQNDRKVPWKAFTRGYHFNLYDLPFEDPEKEDPVWENTRRNIGVIVDYANRRFSDLSKMTPKGSLSSTGYVLANPGSEYLVYAPLEGAFTLDLEAGTYKAEWFNPSDVSISQSERVTVFSGRMSFTPPFAGDAILYLRSSTLGPTPPPSTLVSSHNNPASPP